MAERLYTNNSVTRTYNVVGLNYADQQVRYGAILDQLNAEVRLLAEHIGGPTALIDPGVAIRSWNLSPLREKVREMEEDIVRRLFEDVKKEEYSMTAFASSIPRVVPPVYWPDTNSHPSLQALDVLQRSVLQRQGYHVRFNGLYKVVKQLGSGSYGRVYGMTMRTPEVDGRVLDIIEATNIGHVDTPSGLNELKTYLSSLPRWVAVKTSEDKTGLLREYLVGREVCLALLPLNIRAIPAYFTMFAQSAADTLPYTYTNWAGLYTREQKDEGKRRESDLYSVVGRPTGKVNDEVLLYQEFIDGISLFDAQSEFVDTSEMTMVFCYLHSVLSYLHKQIGFVHGDLHMDNVLLRRKDTILPIIDEDGNVLAYFSSRWDPVFIDMGMAKTNNVTVSGDSTMYSNSQIHDIAYLYRRNQYDKLPSSYKIVYDLLNQGDIDLEERRNGQYVSFFLPPGFKFKAEGVLTHSYIVNTLLASGELDQYRVDPSATVLTSTMSLYKDHAYEEGAPIIEQAERLLKRYTISSTGNQEIRMAVRSYLRETVDYYTSPQARELKESQAQMAAWTSKK